jgi:hypothetical protein
MKIKLKHIVLAVITGFICGLITIFTITAQYELLVWLLLTIGISNYSLQEFKSNIYLNSFLFAVIIGVFITLTHIFFFNSYLKEHKDEIASLDTLKICNSYRLTLLVIAPFYWAILGLICCVFAYFVRFLKIKKK